MGVHFCRGSFQHDLFNVFYDFIAMDAQVSHM